MTRISVIATAAVAALTMVLTLDVKAQQPDTRDRTIMTFSGAVELPGMRLDPGTYVFRLADTATRNVIQVLTEDEMQMLGQWLFIPAERQEATGDTVVTFRETSATDTPAVQFWYYPGERLGKEFIYPKDQAMRIAQRTGVDVMTEEGRIGAQGAVGDAQQQTADVQAAPSQDYGATSTQPPAPAQAEARTPAVEAQGTGTVAGDRAVGTSGAQVSAGVQAQQGTSQDQTYARSELPRTASPLALSALLGLLSLAGAGSVRLFRQ